MRRAEARTVIRPFRRVAETFQALLILGLPFVRMNGESILRFDLTTQRLHVFGSTIWLNEFFLVLIASILFTLFIVLVTVVFGRVWCGWLCPQTVLIDFTPFMDRAKKRGSAYKAGAYAATMTVSSIVAASLIWYFISPYEFFPALVHRKLGTTTSAFWLALSVVIFVNYTVVRHKWCATVCPYAKIQSVLFDRSTLIIELDPKRADECIDCKSCMRVCPTGVDIRRGLDAACINCAECVDACSNVMARNDKRGLIRYAFGPGGGGKLLRQNAYIAGVFFIFFAVLFLHLLGTRTGVDVSVLPNMTEQPFIRTNRVVNAYVLSIDNMREKPVDLTVTVQKFDTTLVQSITEPIHLGPEQHNLFPLFLLINKPADAFKGTRKIKLQLDDRAQNIHIEKEENFTIPDEL